MEARENAPPAKMLIKPANPSGSPFSCSRATESTPGKVTKEPNL
jgi:hypothetical protein